VEGHIIVQQAARIIMTICSDPWTLS